jgi:uncharacterized protein (DUF433 family)
MNMPTVAYPHIDIRADGKPIIAGTRIKVIHLAMERLAYHWDAEEMRRQHPGLTLGQIHSALAYYFDHEEEMNRAIADEERLAEELYQKLRNPALEAKLRAAKRQRQAEGRA